MKQSRRLSIAAFCAAAALCIGISACDDDAGSNNKAKINESCSDKNPCEDGLVCGDEGKCVKEDTPKDPEEKAQEGESCDSETVCEDGLECGEDGVCVQSDSPSDPVDPGQKTDPCEGVTCPDGQQCLNAKCYDPECIDGDHEKACDSGQMCSKGECIDDGCQDKTCESGEICVKGLCEDELCHTSSVVCNDGSTCVKGACVDNECLAKSCDDGLTCVKGACVYPACVGKDACDIGKICNASGDCVFETEPKLVVSATDTQTDENGDSAVIGVSLNNVPTSDVTVTCELSPESAAAEAEVSCENIVFNADNYSEPLMITVVGLPDKLIDEDQQYKLILKSTSEDSDFNGLSAEIDMVNLNVDKVGVTVSDAENLVTSESGSTATFNVVLNSMPTSDVTFVVSTDNADYGIIVGGEDNKLTVTFTPENWNVPQTITVKGVDDDEAVNTEDHVYKVMFEDTQSEDVNYKDLPISPINVTNLDNDIPDAFLDKTEIETTETGAPVDVRVRLGLEPQKPVTMMLMLCETEDCNTETKEAVLLTPEQVTLDANNYKEGVVISIQGQPDNIIDGDQKYFARLVFVSQDNRYANALKDGKFIKGVNKDVDEAGLLKSYTDTTVSESGSSVDIGVSLLSIPAENVTVSVASNNKDEMRATPASLVFTPENWNVPQTVTAKGMEDLVVDGDQTSQIVFKLSTEGDTPFNNIEDKLDIVTLDNDVAEIVVASTGMMVAEDSGATIEFKVSLKAQPDQNVMVNMRSTDESELVINGQIALQFTPENWNAPQTVLLKVVDDSFADGTKSVWIEMESTSADDIFDGLKARTETYMITDNESASVSVSATKQIFKPGETNTATVTVSLSSPPEKDVPVKLNSPNSSAIKFSKSDLVFTTENWATKQTVTMTTTASAAPSAKFVGSISATANGSGSYTNLKSNEVPVTLYAFLSQNFGYLGKEESVTLLPGNYRLQVWGAEGNAQYDGGIAGKGGYSIGTYKLNAKTTFYVNVGGKPYNGGGSAQCAGGGATHIATASGLLSALSGKQSSVLIVAGGGGGGERETGGYGGGTTGNNGLRGSGNCGPVTVTATGANQSAGGAPGTVNNGYGSGSKGVFGKGGDGNCTSLVSGGCDTGAGGGGGWYGGGGIPYCGAGGGGSGHIGTGVSGSTYPGNMSFVAPGGTTETGHSGTGYARITLLD
ncbi:MAG: hypothetical protein IKY83_07750 [Proteobacteria bacterium]|nr:hypothetical protein [Pseudomonadota bacterium]